MKKTSLHLAVAVTIQLVAVGCGDEPAAPEQNLGQASQQAEVAAPESPPVETPAPEPEELDGKTTALSNAGTYRGAWRTDPSPIPLNEGFSIDVWIEDPDDPALSLESISLAADAAMPDHGHGMRTQPRVTRNEDGSFRVDGMMFHMPGYWELYLDVLRGAIRERSQFAIELE